MSVTPLNSEFKLQVFKLLYDQANEEERAAIETTLQKNERAVGWYIEQSMICATLRMNSEASQEERYEDIPSFDSEEMMALAEYEKFAPSVHIPEPDEEEAVIRKLHVVEKTPRKINKLSLFSTIISTAAFLAVVAYLHFSPLPVSQPVATLTDMTHAVWSAGDDDLSKGRQIGAGNWHELLQGFAEITFDNGAVVTLESPVSFMCQSAGSMYVESGKLFTKVSPRAVGFTIDTPHSKIIDLGTEFGINVDKKVCDVQVHKGLVRLYAQPEDEQTPGEHRQVKAGQACSVKADSRKISRIQYDVSRYQTSLPSAYEAAVRAKKPVYYWNFEGSRQDPLKNMMNTDYGSSIYPSSVQFTDGPVLEEKRDNQAIVLSDIPIEISDTVIKQLGKNNKDYTYIVWVRPDAVLRKSGSNIITTAVEKNGKISSCRQIRLNSNGKFQDSFGKGKAETSGWVISKTVAQPGQWYMVAVVANGYKKKLFVNGVNEVSNPHSHGVGENARNSQHKYYFGYVSDKLGNVMGTKHRPPFEGAIDEVAIFDRALTDKEIKKLYKTVSHKR